MDFSRTTSALTWGTAATQAKLYGFSNGLEQEIMDTYTLFGDPATRIYHPSDMFLPTLVRP